jgi:hypothetical protein
LSLRPARGRRSWTCVSAGYSASGVLSNGALTMLRCVVAECDDGVLVQAGSLDVDGCTISDCRCDGIFSNVRITVKDTHIEDVGRHGIKSRGGCDRRGHNRIQASPWDNVGGGMSFPF